ncbi:MAG: hypothetical protein KF761_08945 [Salinibacterium sp.]|nr:hypothetical protein [Salinibacterium sp.]
MLGLVIAAVLAALRLHPAADGTVAPIKDGCTMTRPIPEFSLAELEQLSEVQFTSMTNDNAVALGLTAVEVIREWDLNLAVDIVLADEPCQGNRTRLTTKLLPRQSDAMWSDFLPPIMHIMSSNAFFRQPTGEYRL